MKKRFGPGRVRTKLAAMIARELTAAGYQVRTDPEWLWPTQGYWRSSPYVDVMPWNGKLQVFLHGKWIDWQVDSWSTMSDCVRGFTLEVDGYTVELFANQEREHPSITRMKAKKGAA